jgi:hypothetical protein
VGLPNSIPRDVLRFAYPHKSSPHNPVKTIYSRLSFATEFCNIQVVDLIVIGKWLQKGSFLKQYPGLWRKGPFLGLTPKYFPANAFPVRPMKKVSSSFR